MLEALISSKIHGYKFRSGSFLSRAISSSTPPHSSRICASNVPNPTCCSGGRTARPVEDVANFRLGAASGRFGLCLQGAVGFRAKIVNGDSGHKTSVNVVVMTIAWPWWVGTDTREAWHLFRRGTKKRTEICPLYAMSANQRSQRSTSRIPSPPRVTRQVSSRQQNLRRKR